MSFGRRALLLAVAAMSLALSQVAQAQQAGTSVLETIKQRGKLVIGLSTFVPWAMLDKSGKLVGFEVDVGKKLAADMGVEPEFVPTAWDGIIPALLAGRFDMIISGMSITPARNLTVNFSEPYAYSGLRIVANRKLEEKLADISDLNSADITLALRRGATPVAFAQQTFPKAKLLQLDDEGAQIQEVVSGRADATIASEPLPSSAVADYPDQLYIPFDDLLNVTAEGIAVRKGDPDVLNFLNNWIAANWRNDFLQERNDFWFRTEEWTSEVSPQ